MLGTNATPYKFTQADAVFIFKKHTNSVIRSISNNGESRHDTVSDASYNATVTAGEVAAGLNAWFLHQGLLY